MSCRVAGPLVAVVLGTVVGCQKPQEMKPFQPEPDYSRPLPPGQLALRKIGPEAYPDFSRGFADRAGLEEAIRNSLEYLGRPSSRRYFPYGDVSHARAVRSLERFLELLRTARSGTEFDAAIRREFDVYQSVGWDGRGTVWFTGYYTPIFEGRRQREGRFRYPLYAKPVDLVVDPEGVVLGRRRPDGSVEPGYPTRRQIEEGRILDGQEIAWLKDPFEAYVATVQGSAKLRLPDGTLYELGYAGNNGHEYTPIAKQMIADGVIDKNRLSLQTLLEYFRANPQKTYYYTWKNDRYVFFQERPGGTWGSLNVQVTPYRTIATDKSVYPRACLSYLVTTLPRPGGQQGAYAGFALDQDTGGAIRAAGRCDLYIGTGPSAESIAGRVGAEGKLYYLFVKE